MIPRFLRRFFWPHRFRLDLLDSKQLVHLRQSVLQSPYLAPTDLAEGFEGSYGFSIFFQAQHRARVEKELAGVAAFFEQVIDPRTNVFFLNPLVLYRGNDVEPHADKTLLSFLDWPPRQVPYPTSVSVLYLQIPEGVAGGELVMHRWFGALKLTPLENSLIEFPGSLVHGVTAWQGDDQTPRVSLVLEQYQLPPSALEIVPDWFLYCEKRFSDFLQEVAISPDSEESEPELNELDPELGESEPELDESKSKSNSESHLKAESE